MKILATLLLFVGACAAAEAPPATITAEALAARLGTADAPFVLDVRTEAEYAAGHIPGAVWIPHDELPARLSELRGREGEEIVVHCKSGRRAGMAEQVLHEAGFTHVVDLEGHMNGWQEGGFPTEAGAP